MQPTREQNLSAIKEGDVIYGIAAGGQEKLLLVYKATPSAIFARHVTTQTKVEFGRDGRSRRCEAAAAARSFPPLGFRKRSIRSYSASIERCGRRRSRVNFD